MQLLYARLGQSFCPVHHYAIQAQTISQMVDSTLALSEGTAIMILAPVVRERKGEHVQRLEQLKFQGFIRARIDRQLVKLDEAPRLRLRNKYTIEVVIDRLKVRPEIQQRLAESFETAIRLANGLATVAPSDNDHN